jgi:hypothetical protein
VTLPSDGPAADAPAADAPAADAPAADAPAADAPAADAPAADAPAADAPAAERGPCCHVTMRPGGPHAPLAVRHVLNMMMQLVGRATHESLAALEAASDADSVLGHSSSELLACMRVMDLGWPESEMLWCVSGCL